MEIDMLMLLGKAFIFVPFFCSCLLFWYLSHEAQCPLIQMKNSDIALEAEFLASLNHPHIIKLRGMTHSKAAGFANGAQGFFLIIDRLEETLDHCIQTWKRKSRPRRASTGVGRDELTDEQMNERLSIGRSQWQQYWTSYIKFCSFLFSHICMYLPTYL